MQPTAILKSGLTLYGNFNKQGYLETYKGSLKAMYCFLGLYVSFDKLFMIENVLFCFEFLCIINRCTIDKQLKSKDDRFKTGVPTFMFIDISVCIRNYRHLSQNLFPYIPLYNTNIFSETSGCVRKKRKYRVSANETVLKYKYTSWQWCIYTFRASKLALSQHGFYCMVNLIQYLCQRFGFDK